MDRCYLKSCIRGQVVLSFVVTLVGARGGNEIADSDASASVDLAFCKVAVKTYLQNHSGEARLQNLMQHLKKVLGGQKLPEEKVLYDFLKNYRKRGHEDRQDFDILR